MKYLTPADIPETGVVLTVRAMQRELIDGRPRLVVYFDGEERGLPLTRELADEITKVLGPSSMVEEFFGSNDGALH